MKTILISFLTATLLTVGCAPQYQKNVAIDEYDISVIEGCQYLVTRGYVSEKNLCHKGNCTNSIHLYNK